MKKDYYNVIVIMSETSLLGVDLACVEIQGALAICLTWSIEIKRKINVLSM